MPVMETLSQPCFPVSTLIFSNALKTTNTYRESLLDYLKDYPLYKTSKKKKEANFVPNDIESFSFSLYPVRYVSNQDEKS